MTPRRRRLLAKAAAGGVAALAVAFGVVSTGLLPTKASSGHWPITRWLLEYSMERSVATQSLWVEEPPPLDDPGLVLRGAGHYEGGCRPCHGAPGDWSPRIPQAMTPHPPDLATMVPQWDAKELFRIVRDGVKFTGMPAWPALERDDEVWAVVAFLRILPDTDPDAYRRLVRGDAAVPAEAPAAVAASCARCHGADGRSRGDGAFPRLAGQRPAYLAASLRAYAAGKRHSGIMEPIAAAMGEETIVEVTRWYASRPPAPPAASPPPDAAAVLRGAEIAARGLPRQGVPSCADCHGPSPTKRNPVYPVLAGQEAWYLALQLDLFQKGHRGGTPYAHLMRTAAAHLTPAQIGDVALYYATLPPDTATRASASR